MEEIKFSMLLMSFSIAMLVVCGPMTGLPSVVSIVLNLFEKTKPSCKVSEINFRILMFLENKWWLRAQFALISVLTPIIFLNVHRYNGEGFIEVINRLTLTHFFTH